jgi:replicative DNA helicase
MARIIGDEAIRLGGEARKSTAAFAQSAIDDWEWSYKNQGEYSGIPSGLVDVDRIMWGFQKQDLILVGGRPSTGKSSLVIQFAAHAAIDLKKPTLVFSLETTGKAVVKRIACQRAQVSQTVLRSGRETREDMDKIAIQVGKITHSPLYIVDTKKLRISQVEGIARQYKEQYGIEMVVVDYLQKVYPDRQHEKRTYEVSQVAEGLKSMAEDNDVPVVVAAQLNRESDKGGKGGTPRQPRLSDFADSGKIEQEADAAILLHHDGDKSWLLIPKVRDGETNMVPVKFNKQWTRFDSASFPTKFDIPKENTNYDNE